MSDAKQPSKRRRRSKTLPVLGAAGLSLSLASTASAVPGGPAVDLANPGNVGAGALVGWSGATNVPAICVRARLDHFFLALRTWVRVENWRAS
jgi:hypothetical protein